MAARKRQQQQRKRFRSNAYAPKTKRSSFEMTALGDRLMRAACVRCHKSLGDMMDHFARTFASQVQPEDFPGQDTAVAA